MGVRSYKDLIVWQKSMLLVKEIFKITQSFPKSEMYGLSSQLRRASVAIPSNIAEGSGRRSKKELLQFYSIAYGSALETETQLLIAKDLGFAKTADFVTVEALLTEILKMLNAIMRNLKIQMSVSEN